MGGNHARLSASASHRWIRCPGSIQLIERLDNDREIPAAESADHAAEGTAAHYLLELCLVELVKYNNWNISACAYIGDYILVHRSNGETDLILKKVAASVNRDRKYLVFPINNDMADAVNVCLDHVRLVLRQMGTENGTIPSDVSIELEHAIDLDHLDNPNLGGKLDIRICQTLGQLHITDYKHGKGLAVHPEENPQLMYYALDKNVMSDEMPDEVHLTIVQPRCSQVDPVQTWITTPAHIERWANDVMIPAAKKAVSEDPPFCVGEVQCRWCRAHAHCPATQELALSMARKEFALDADAAVAGLSREDFARLYGRIDVLKQTVKAMEARALHDLQAGKPVPGYKLVEGIKNRVWKDDAEEKLKALIPKDVLYETKLVSPAKLERNKAYKEVIKDLIIKPKGAPRVVPESDKRPALPASVNEAFEEWKGQ